MESNKKIFFEIMSNDDKTIVAAIASFNQIYKKTSKIINFDLRKVSYYLKK